MSIIHNASVLNLPYNLSNNRKPVEPECINISETFKFTGPRSYMFLALVLIDIIHDSQASRGNSATNTLETNLTGTPLRLLVYSQMHDLCILQGNDIKPVLFKRHFHGLMSAFIHLGLDLSVFFDLPCNVRSISDIVNNLDLLIWYTVIKPTSGFEKHTLIAIMNFMPANCSPEVFNIGNRDPDSVFRATQSKTFVAARKRASTYVNYDCSQNGLMRMFLEEFGYHSGLPGKFDPGYGMPSRSGINSKLQFNSGNCEFKLLFDVLSEVSPNIGIAVEYQQDTCSIGPTTTTENRTCYSKKLASASKLRITASFYKDFISTTQLHPKLCELRGILSSFSGAGIVVADNDIGIGVGVSVDIVNTVIDLFTELYYTDSATSIIQEIKNITAKTFASINCGKYTLNDFIEIWARVSTIDDNRPVEITELNRFNHVIGESDRNMNITFLYETIQSQLNNSTNLDDNFWYGEIAKTRYYADRLSLKFNIEPNFVNAVLSGQKLGTQAITSYISTLTKWWSLNSTNLPTDKYSGDTIFFKMVGKTMGDLGQILYAMSRGHIFATEDTMAAAIAFFLLTTFGDKYSCFGVVYGGSQDYIVTSTMTF